MSMPSRMASARNHTGREERKRTAPDRGTTKHLRIRAAPPNPSLRVDTHGRWLVEIYHGRGSSALWGRYDELPASVNLDVYALRKRAVGFRVLIQRQSGF